MISNLYEKSQLTGRFFAFVAATTTGAVVVAAVVVPAAVLPVPVEGVLEVVVVAAPPVFV